MLKFKSIRNELTIILTAAIAVLLLLVAAFIINNVANNSGEKARQGLSNALQFQAKEITSFFDKRGQIVKTFLSSPQLIQWFASYSQRQKDISSDTSYLEISQMFKNIADADPTIKAAFFASASTGEYFDIGGRYNDDPEYFATKRPWWGEAMAQNRLFVTKPEVDYVDKSVVSSVKQPVRVNNQLIGIAGIDILLSTIEQELLSQLKYQGEGRAFLVDHDGSIIFFPPNGTELKADENLANLDNKLTDATGFSDLAKDISKNTRGISALNWQGKSLLVAYEPVHLDSPNMNWTLGLMVNKTLVDQVIEQTVWTSLIVVVGILLVIALIVRLLATRMIKPLGMLLTAMDDIASGEGDLTKRLTLDSNNEIGQLSVKFNAFIENIHQLIKLNKAAIEEVKASNIEVVSVTHLTNKSAEQQQQEIEQIAAAAQELTYAVQSIADNSSQALKAADEAEEQANIGREVVSNATHSIESLAKGVNSAALVVNNLNEQSGRIGEVLEVIRSIADQTNLLALNAAIEAARAGDQGRGFAVVADEVRTLASRTQESTESINQIIGNLQNSAKDAVQAMSSGAVQAQESVEQVKDVKLLLEKIADLIDQIQLQSAEIDSATHEQSRTAQEISQKTVRIKELAEQTANQAHQVRKDTDSQQDQIDAMTSIVSRFKI